MKNAIIVIGNSIRRRLGSIKLIEIVLHSTLNILPFNVDEIVSVISTLLVPKTNCMQNFVNYCAQLVAARRLYVNFLTPSNPSHTAPASGLRVLDKYEVFVKFSLSWHKANAGFLLELVEGPFYGVVVPNV